MRKKIYLFICMAIIFAYGSPVLAQTEKKFPHDVVTFIDEQLANVNDAETRQCMKDEIYAILEEHLTDEELASADYNGEPNMGYIKNIVSLLAKVGRTISDVFHTSSCITREE